MRYQIDYLVNGDVRNVIVEACDNIDAYFRAGLAVAETLTAEERKAAEVTGTRSGDSIRSS